MKVDVKSLWLSSNVMVHWTWEIYAAKCDFEKETQLPKLFKVTIKKSLKKYVNNGAKLKSSLGF